MKSPFDQSPKNGSFRHAVENAARALARRSHESAPVELRLPADGPIEFQEVGPWRGMADAMALRQRFHSPQTHQKRAPTEGPGRAAFEVLEQLRCEALGVREFCGIATNLQASLAKRSVRQGFHRVTQQTQVLKLDALRLLGFDALIAPVPSEAEPALSVWGEFCDEHRVQIANLASHLHDQAAFAKHAKALLQAMNWLAPADANDDEAAPENDDEDTENAPHTGDEGENPPPEIATGEGDEQVGPTAAEGGLSEAETDENLGGSEEAGRGERRSFAAQPADLYKNFTNAYDSIADASDLCDPSELSRLRALLDQRLSHLQGLIGRLAHRLQRHLMAQQQRAWEFDVEEGYLDVQRLPQIVINPLMPLSFKREQSMKFRDTVVTLLIDNSGSMRGWPISVAAMTSDILARTLERCGVAVEVLGFTTKAWKGGESREAWLRAGKPLLPGRLNDLLHIIYKSADQPWRRTRKNLGLMLQEGLLKQNIDGEALSWAYQRLLARPEQRRILMVISDGAPVDDATLAVNPAHFLDAHLRQVIGEIEKRGLVQLAAVGIGHEVGSYYQRAVTIHEPEQFSVTLMMELASLFSEHF